MLTDHIVNSINNHELVNDSTLHVVGVVSNPVRYHSRYRLFREWVDEMNSTPNVKLHLVELAYGDRQFECTSSNDLQLRSSHELWSKENLINLGVRYLVPRTARYIAWVDTDVSFYNKHWALETIHQLQHWPVVQPWSECADMGPDGNILQLFRSFASLNQKGIKIQANKDEPYVYGHSGFAWACTRTFWENVHGLIDFAILGSADHHMAWAMVNQVERSVHDKTSDAFKRRCKEWQTWAFRQTNGHLGAIKGHLVHKFHGPKNRRYYRERWQILVDHKFNPDTDLRYDWQGLIHIVGKPHLDEAIRAYHRSRHEDSIEES